MKTHTLLQSALLAALGCVPPPPPAAPAVRAGASPACTVVASGTAPAESLLVATPLSIDASHAPHPANAAERFAFAQSYETLINVDCDGRTYTGLAQSWTTDATKTRVTLVLRDAARFSSGDPVFATDVLTAWRATGDAPTDAGRLARRLADAATIVDERTLIVSLPDTASRVLADRALAVHRPAVGASWPEGTGPYRIAESTPATLTLMSVSSRSAPRLVVRSRTGADARDQIDAGADVILAADASAVRYAATRSDLVAVPLPWTNTYALAANNAARQLLPSGDSTGQFRASLARDAVSAEARVAEPSDASSCELHASAVARPDANVSVAYRADDRVARAIAERLVAVGRFPRAAPLAPAEFARSLRVGTHAAYIVSFPRTSLAPCRDLAALVSSAPWLSNSGAISEMLVPLVDTRERAVLNRARVSAVIDWDGTLRMIADRP